MLASTSQPHQRLQAFNSRIFDVLLFGDDCLTRATPKQTTINFARTPTSGYVTKSDVEHRNVFDYRCEPQRRIIFLILRTARV